MAARSIYKMLDLSTAHLNPESVEALERHVEPDSPITVIGESEYGWIVYVSEPDLVKEMPAVLAAILEDARRHGCDYVRFDRDGPVEDDLPTFEW